MTVFLGRSPGPASAPPFSVSAVVLSYNRRQAVEATLARLAEDDVLRTSQVIVADNASTDGTLAAVRALYAASMCSNPPKIMALPASTPARPAHPAISSFSSTMIPGPIQAPCAGRSMCLPRSLGLGRLRSILAIRNPAPASGALLNA
jgi:glycosyltransferase involved in cell wall biosynthesis